MNSEIILRWRNERTAVSPDEIIYVESYNRHLIVFTLHAKTEIVGKLDDFLELLPRDEFVSTHKSFAVNMKYISGINRDDVLMVNGALVPMSVRRKTLTLRKYDEYCKYSGGEK